MYMGSQTPWTHLLIPSIKWVPDLNLAHQTQELHLGNYLPLDFIIHSENPSYFCISHS